MGIIVNSLMRVILTKIVSMRVEMERGYYGKPKKSIVLAAVHCLPIIALHAEAASTYQATPAEHQRPFS